MKNRMGNEIQFRSKKLEKLCPYILSCADDSWFDCENYKPCPAYKQIKKYTDSLR